MKPCAYNPLDYASLSDTLAQKLMSAELIPLVDIEPFYGNGVYALFYSGDFPPYAEMADINVFEPGTLPIYIGEACPKTLKGNDLNAAAVDARESGSALYNRVAKDHRKSIEQAINLDVRHFACKMSILNAVWVPLTESALIGKYVPIWNSVLPGFGNHDPGKGRKDGRISRWDILHPGRGRETGTPTAIDAQQLEIEVESAIRERVGILGL